MEPRERYNDSGLLREATAIRKPNNSVETLEELAKWKEKRAGCWIPLPARLLDQCLESKGSASQEPAKATP